MVKEMLLFGAGASQEAGVPTAFVLTEKIAEEFHNDDLLALYSPVVSFVLGGLLFNRGIHGENPLRSGVNVEEFFNAIQLLAGRHTLEAAPFVGSWHSMVEELDKIAPSGARPERLHEIIYKSVIGKLASALPSSMSLSGMSHIDRKVAEAIKKGVEAGAKGRATNSSASIGVGKEVGDMIADFMKKWTSSIRNSRPASSDFGREFKRAVDRAPRPGEGKIFRQVADEMIAMLVKFVFVEDSSRICYLEPLKHLAAQQFDLTIATLNYDNCVELFCETNQVRCDTGISEWSERGTFEGNGEGILLLKLHGSIDWEQSEHCEPPGRPMPHRVIQKANPEEMKAVSYRPAVIFGSRNKLTAEGPFLDLLRAFQRELDKADRLTVVGYSFADPHINVYISQWLNTRDHRCVRIINGPNAQRRAEGYLAELLAYAGARVEVVPKYAGEGLADCFPSLSMTDIADSSFDAAP